MICGFKLKLETYTGPSYLLTTPQRSKVSLVAPAQQRVRIWRSISPDRRLIREMNVTRNVTNFIVILYEQELLKQSNSEDQLDTTEGGGGGGGGTGIKLKIQCKIINFTTFPSRETPSYFSVSD